MPNSSPQPPSATTERHLGDPNPKEAPPDISALNHMPEKHKKTRELPNLSDCHGCSRRINYSNPRQRLQPLDSFWRIVLLCKKCRKQVSNGQLCTYCFKDTSKSVSDCFSCANCHHLVHKDCVLHYGYSAPWVYCTYKVGLSFDLCIDCWIPDKLKKSVSVKKKRKRRVQKSVTPVNLNNGHGKCSGKVNGGGRTSANDAKEAKCALEKKIVVAAKAKQIALKKALAARNAVVLASHALDLVATKEKDVKEGLLGSSSSSSNGGNSAKKVVDDAELAVQLHHAMNSSRRLIKKFTPLKFRCSELLKKPNSSAEIGKESYFNFVEDRIHGRNDSLEPNCKATGELKPDVVTYTRINRKKKELHQSGTESSRRYGSRDSHTPKPEIITYSRKRKECESSVKEANGSPICIDAAVVQPETFTCEQNDGNMKELRGASIDAIGSCTHIDFAVPKPESLVTYNEVCSCTHPGGLNQELVTYKRKNNKRKECERCGGGYAKGSVATHAYVEDSSLVRGSQTSLQEESKGEKCGNDGRSSSKPEGYFVDVSAEDRTRISISDSCLLIESKRLANGDDIFTQDKCGNTYSDLYSLKYSRKRTATGSILQERSSHSHHDGC